MSTVASQVACKHGVDGSRDFTRASIKRYTKSREIYEVSSFRWWETPSDLLPSIHPLSSTYPCWGRRGSRLSIVLHMSSLLPIHCDCWTFANDNCNQETAKYSQTTTILGNSTASDWTASQTSICLMSPCSAAVLCSLLVRMQAAH